MRRKIRRNKEYPVQLQAGANLFSRREVAGVDGIECTAEDT